MEALCDQGCRPVGEAAIVTSSHRGTIMELDHQTALLVVSPALLLPHSAAALPCCCPALLLGAPSCPHRTMPLLQAFCALKSKISATLFDSGKTSATCCIFVTRLAALPVQ